MADPTDRFFDDPEDVTSAPRLERVTPEVVPGADNIGSEPADDALPDEGPDLLTCLRAAAFAEWQMGRGHWLPVVDAIDRGDTLLGRTR